VRQTLTRDDAWGFTPLDHRWCRKRIQASRSEGIFAPPSLEGTVAILPALWRTIRPRCCWMSRPVTADLSGGLKRDGLYIHAELFITYRRS
jgi:hypothetical protein